MCGRFVERIYRKSRRKPVAQDKKRNKRTRLKIYAVCLVLSEVIQPGVKQKEGMGKKDKFRSV